MGTAHAVAKKATKNETAASRHHTKAQAFRGTVQDAQSGFPEGQFFIQRKENACVCGGGCPRCAGVIQPKHTISQPNDKYEQEADRVPDQVMAMPETTVQRQVEEDEEEPIQTKLIFDQITPLVQRRAEPEEEEEPAQMKSLVQGQEEEESLQRKFITSETPALLKADVREAENHTGMPHPLKAGIETLSGMDLSGVRVYNNSSKPAQLNALAYTQGQDIHVGPGQENHLPHEGWHAVQQMQGRVKPTMQAKGVWINDDEELEREADVMGRKALELKGAEQAGTGLTHQQGATSLEGEVETKGESEVTGETIGTSGKKGRLNFLHSGSADAARVGARYRFEPRFLADAPVQRDAHGIVESNFDKNQLKFTSKVFNRPLVCPSCHRQPPRQHPMFDDRRATTDRLRAWAVTSGRSRLLTDATIRKFQVEPGSEGRVVDRVGVELIRHIVSSHEFEGSDRARRLGAETIRGLWLEVRARLLSEVTSWYQREVAAALAATPNQANLIFNPATIVRARTTPESTPISTGRLSGMATPGQRFGSIVMVETHPYHGVTFHFVGKPAWLYRMGSTGFIKRDPMMDEFARQVVERTKFAALVLPIVVKMGGFALGLGGGVLRVIAGIALEELGEEMERDMRGLKARSASEIAKSATFSLFLDRFFNKLGGSVVAKGGQASAKIEAAADKAVRATRAELVATEKRLVTEAIQEKGARSVTNPSMKAKGYVAEVDVTVAGRRHTYRLAKSGQWCRFTAPVCGVDLGADVTQAAKKAVSPTAQELVRIKEVTEVIYTDLDRLREVELILKRDGKLARSRLTRDQLDALEQVGLDNPARVTRRSLARAITRHGSEASQHLGRVKGLLKKLYEEGRSLYDRMRAVSPGGKQRAVVNRRARGLDEVTGRPPRSGATHVDHVVPLNEIVQMPGFAQIRSVDDQLAIVNYGGNLRAVDAAANTSRGERSWAAWGQALVYYSRREITAMSALEGRIRAELLALIARVPKKT